MKLQKLTKAWFYFPDDPDGVSFEIKHLLAGEISEIIERTYKQGFEFKEDKNGELKPVPVFKTNRILEKELTVCAVITDWENFFDENGNILDCTNENKIRLCNELSEEEYKIFLDFIIDCRLKLSNTVKEQAGAEKKT